MPRIVTMTVNPSVDKSTSIERMVSEDKLRCESVTAEPGGGGINVARAIARLGGTASALWSCGGPTGQLLEKLLDAEQINHRAIPLNEDTRENLTVYERSTGKQFRLCLPGPDFEHREQISWLEELRFLEPPPDFLVASGSLPPGVANDFYAQAARTVPSVCRVIIDTKGPALRASLTDFVFMVKPNLRELGELTGREIDTDTDIRDAAREVINANGVQMVVVSLGRGGAVMVTADDCEHFRSPTVPISSKVGAGDSMVAGIVASLARGKSTRQAVAFGVAAGAAAVMTPGSELCRRTDVERLYKEFAG